MITWFEPSMVHSLSACFSAISFEEGFYVAVFAAVIGLNKLDLKSPEKSIPFKPPRLVSYTDLKKRWYIIFYAWDPEVKKLKRVRYAEGLNDFKTYNERLRNATLVMAEIHKQLKAGLVFVEPEKPVSEKPISDSPLAKAMEFVLDQKKDTIGKGWADSYTWVIKLVKRYFEKKEIPVTALKKKDFIDLMTWIKANTKAGPKTLNEYSTIISTCLNYLINMELLSVNYMEKIPKLKVPKGHTNIPFTLQEVAQIKNEAEKLNDGQFILFFQFLLYTLARPGKEIRLLQVKDIRPTTIWIPIERGKTGGRSVDIAPGLENIIESEKLRSYPPDYYIFGSEGKPGPVERKRTFFRDHFQLYLRKTGLKDRGHTLYAFKHTGAIQAVIAGVDILAIQKMIGHTTLAQTTDYLINIGAIRTTRNELAKLPEY